MIDEAQDYRIRFFNVSHMANLRGDAHSRPDSDCLHTCLPGKLIKDGLVYRSLTYLNIRSC